MNVSKELVSNLESVASTLEIRLQNKAINAGWPLEAARALKIDFDNPPYFVSYPESMSTTIDNLEYGDRETPPKPVIRTFSEGSELISDNVSDLTIDIMSGKEGAF